MENEFSRMTRQSIVATIYPARCLRDPFLGWKGLNLKGLAALLAAEVPERNAGEIVSKEAVFYSLQNGVEASHASGFMMTRHHGLPVCWYTAGYT